MRRFRLPPDRQDDPEMCLDVPPGEYSVVLRGDAQVPFNRDPAAANRPLVRVADPSTPWAVTVTPARKK
jgi:hypothetical protein